MREQAPFNFFEEKEMQQEYEVRRISDGLAFGDGEISGHDDTAEVLAITDEAIEQSPNLLVPVDCDDDGRELDDDGCGDGRGVKLVFKMKETFKRSLNRAKVFGGAAVMTAASIIGRGQANEQPLNDVFDEAIDTLEARRMDFGAHTDENAHGESCGCGAIDKAPEALQAALEYEEPIRGIIEALGADTEQLDAVYDNFRSYVGTMPAHPRYSGRRVMDRIVGAGKVVKQLAGQHRERRIILNTVRGYTVDQSLIRAKTGGRAQVFAVDVWRLEEIAAGLHPDSPEDQSRAYLSELIYTLSVAGVLTKGDLPVYLVQAASSPVAA